MAAITTTTVSTTTINTNDTITFIGANGSSISVEINDTTLADILENAAVKEFFDASDLALEGDCIFQHIVGVKEEDADDDEVEELTPMQKFQMLTAIPAPGMALILDIDGKAEVDCGCPGCPNATANIGKIKVLSSGGQLTYMVDYTEGMSVYDVLQNAGLQAAFAFGEADIKLLDIDLYKNVGGADPTITRIAHNATESVIVKPGDVISIVGREVACTKG